VIEVRSAPPMATGIYGEFRHAEADVAAQAVGDGVIQAVDKEERTLLQGQRVGPGAIEVRQTAVMRFDDVAEGDRAWAALSRADRLGSDSPRHPFS